MLAIALMVALSAMTYGQVAAILVEMFPARIRYTSMSLPYHIGNGWFGGMLPLLATAMVAASGDIYYGLWYPIVVAAMTLILGTLFLVVEEQPRRRPVASDHVRGANDGERIRPL